MSKIQNSPLCNYGAILLCTFYALYLYYLHPNNALPVEFDFFGAIAIIWLLYMGYRGYAHAIAIVFIVYSSHLLLSQTSLIQLIIQSEASLFSSLLHFKVMPNEIINLTTIPVVVILVQNHEFRKAKLYVLIILLSYAILVIVVDFFSVEKEAYEILGYSLLVNRLILYIVSLLFLVNIPIYCKQRKSGLLVGIIIVSISFVFVPINAAITTKNLKKSRSVLLVLAPEENNAHDIPTSLYEIGFYHSQIQIARRHSYRVDTLSSIDVAATLNYDVIVVLSGYRQFSAANVKQLKKYAENGGRLVLVGEHTNMDSNMIVINQIASDYGMRLQFNTTHNIYGDIPANLSYSPSMIGAAIKSDKYFTFNRGAAIKISGFYPIEPVYWGNLWHADVGRWSDADNSYGGDGIINNTEYIGRNLLIARLKAGYGEVFLVGDSSPFLNQNIPYCNKFYNVLYRRIGGLDTFASIFHVGYFLFLLLFVYRLRTTGEDTKYLYLSLILIISFAGSLYPTQSDSKGIDVSIDMSVVPDIEMDPFGEYSLSGLGFVLSTENMRLGYVNEYSRNAPYILFVNPQIDFLDKVGNCINNNVSNVIVTGNPSESAISSFVGKYFGFFSYEPIGRYQSKVLSTTEAYRILGVKKSEAICVQDSICIGVRKKYRSTNLIYFTDRGLFLNRGLISHSDITPENIKYIKYLFNRDVNFDK